MKKRHASLRKALAANARAAKLSVAKQREAEKDERRRHRQKEKEKVVDLVQRARQLNAHRLLHERNEDGTEAVAE